MRYQLIGLHGAPRSGTTWLGEIFNSHEQVAYRYQPFFSYAFRDRVDETSDAQAMQRLFDDLLASDDPFVRQMGAARLARSATSFDKAAPTHLVYKEVRFHHLLRPLLDALPGFRCVGIVRDPRAVLVSWRDAPREFDPSWAFSEEWRHAAAKNAGLVENWFGFERWKALTHLFLRLASDVPQRFSIVQYEHLLSQPQAVVADLFAFAGLPPSAQASRFIDASLSRDDDDPYGVFRQRDALLHRRPDLPDTIGREIEADLAGTPLARFLWPDA